MKQQKFEPKPGKLQKSIAQFGIRDVSLSHASNTKSLSMPELKETGGKRGLQRNSSEFRRKTRSQALSEKQAKEAVSTSLAFLEVSIETLHSICAPSVSQQANKGRQKQQPSKSTSRSTNRLKQFGFAPNGLLSSPKQYLFHTFGVHSPDKIELQNESHNKRSGTKRSSLSSSAADNLHLEETWLEVFVEIDDGIDLVVDLNSRSIADWFMESNSSTLLHPDVADEFQRQCGTDTHPNDHPEGACSGSSDIEAPSANTTPQDNKDTTFCLAAGGDAGSQTDQMGQLAGCFPSCKLAEVIDSQESSNSEVKDPGFNFGSLEQMPTFFATGMRRSSAEEGEVTCNANWMVACIGA